MRCEYPCMNRSSSMQCAFTVVCVALAGTLPPLLATHAHGAIPGHPPTDGPSSARLRAVAELIMDLIHPEQWTMHGGTTATLQNSNGDWHVELHDSAFSSEAKLNPHAIVRDVETFMRRHRPIFDGQPREIVAAASLLGYRDSDEDSRTLALLEQRRINIEFNGTPLSEALLALQRQSGLVIEPDWGPLDTIAIAPDLLITLRADNQSIGEALRSLCRALGNELDRPFLQLDRGQVVVTTQDRAREHIQLAVYDVHDLIELILREIPSRPDGTRPEATIVDREEPVRHVIDVLQECVDPEGWRDLGGNTSSLIVFDEYLFIRTTPANHRAITRLLAALREASDEDIPEVHIGPLDQRAWITDVDTRVYDVLDLLHAPFGQPGGEKIIWSEARHDEMTRMLIDVLLELIEPEHWRVLGGEDGSLLQFAGMLVITTTLRNHPRVGALLNAMRQAVNQPRRVIHAGLGDPHPAHDVMEIRLYPISNLLIAMRRDFDSVREARWALVNWLQESVDPAGWRELAGNVSRLLEFQGVLIIETTPQNHEAIARVLDQLFRSERAGRKVID